MVKQKKYKTFFYKKNKKTVKSLTKKQKKIKNKINKNYTIKKNINKKNIKKGGNLPELSRLIGQGTHGKIYLLKDDDSLVVKVFENRKINNCMSLCKSIHPNNCFSCDELNYEYIMQNKINYSFKEHELNIIVPNAFNFETKDGLCYYIMDRIFTLQDTILYVDMTDKDKLKKINIGQEIGYEIASNYLNISSSQLAYNIGEMFSLLHFKLNVDGYDCELIIGKNKIDEKKPQLYFIDFDKVSCFEFKLDQTLYRKISEEYVEEKNITSIKKLTYFLFQSFISMSLLPIDYELKQQFLEGYHKYFNLKNSFESEVMSEIIKIVNEYTV
jgi:hypothetical protein